MHARAQWDFYFQRDLSHVPLQRTVTKKIQHQTKVRYLLPSLDLTENCLSQLLRAKKIDVGYTLSSYHHKQVTALVVDYVGTRPLKTLDSSVSDGD